MKSILTAEEYAALTEDNPVRAEYTVLPDGSYALTVEGVLPREIQVARQTKAERDTLATGLAAAQAAAQAATNASVDPPPTGQPSGDPPAAGQTPRDVQQRLDAMARRVAATEKELKDANDRLIAERFRTAAHEAAVKAGVRPEAIIDVLARAEATGFKLRDTGALETDPDLVSGQPVEFAAWLDAQRTGGAPHLFTPSSGSGAQGAGAPGSPDAGRASRTTTVEIPEEIFGDPEQLGVFAAARRADHQG